MTLAPAIAPADFEPTYKQSLLVQALVNHAVDEILYGGGRGGAKTIGLCLVIWLLSSLYPGNEILVVRRDMVDLKSTTLKEFRTFMARYYPQARVEWCLASPVNCRIHINGQVSTVWWADTKDPDSLRSANLSSVLMDEADEIADDFYLMISAALGRHTLPDGTRPPRKLIATCNPGPGWCKRLFPVGKELAKRTRDGICRIFIPALPRDNPHLPADFEANLRAKYPEVWVRRWVEGDWDAFEGQVFDEFDEAVHVIPPRDLSRFPYTHLICHDWGFRNVAAALAVTIDYEGTFIVWREHRMSGMTPAEHKPYLSRLAEGFKPSMWLIDYAAVDQSSGVTIREQYNNAGLPFMGCQKDKNGPDGSLMFIKVLLKAGRLLITRNCAGLIEEMKSARWQELTPMMAATKNPAERMIDKDDHSIDCLSMAVQFYRMQKHEPKKPHEERQTAMAWAESGARERENAIRGRRDWEGEWTKKRERAGVLGGL